MLGRMTFSSVVRTAAGTPRLVRVGALSPYAVEVLADDALRAGPGAQLDVAVGGGAHVEAVRARLAWLARRGIAVVVSRAPDGACGAT
jgi:hypothetical protein